MAYDYKRSLERLSYLTDVTYNIKMVFSLSVYCNVINFVVHPNITHMLHNLQILASRKIKLFDYNTQFREYYT